MKRTLFLLVFITIFLRWPGSSRADPRSETLRECIAHGEKNEQPLGKIGPGFLHARTCTRLLNFGYYDMFVELSWKSQQSKKMVVQVIDLGASACPKVEIELLDQTIRIEYGICSYHEDPDNTQKATSEWLWSVRRNRFFPKEHSLINEALEYPDLHLAAGLALKNDRFQRNAWFEGFLMVAHLKAEKSYRQGRILDAAARSMAFLDKRSSLALWDWGSVLGPTSPALLNDMGFFLQQAWFHHEAIPVLQAVQQIDEKRVPLHLNIGDSFWAIGKEYQARKHYRLYLELLQEARKLKKAPARVAQRLNGTGPQGTRKPDRLVYGNHYLVKARQSLKDHDLDLARGYLALFDRFGLDVEKCDQQTSIDFLDATHRLALGSHQSGKKQSAAAYVLASFPRQENRRLHSARSGAPNLIEFLIWRTKGCLPKNEQTAEQLNDCASFLMEGGLVQPAVEMMQSIAAVFPNDAVTHLNLADALWIQGKRNESLSHYQHCLRLHPKNVEIPARVTRRIDSPARHEELYGALRVSASESKNAAKSLVRGIDLVPAQTKEDFVIVQTGTNYSQDIPVVLLGTDSKQYPLEFLLPSGEERKDCDERLLGPTFRSKKSGSVRGKLAVIGKIPKDFRWQAATKQDPSEVPACIFHTFDDQAKKKGLRVHIAEGPDNIRFFSVAAPTLHPNQSVFGTVDENKQCSRFDTTFARANKERDRYLSDLIGVAKSGDFHWLIYEAFFHGGWGMCAWPYTSKDPTFEDVPPRLCMMIGGC